jgi:hypothetical protein
MSTRRNFRAMTRGADQAKPVAALAGAALILGGLLLLRAPCGPAGRLRLGTLGSTAATEP